MRKVKILIVEDEAITALMLKNILTDIGYNVLKCVVSAHDAVAYTKKLKPDLILMDIVLKGNESGIDAAKVIKEKLNIPIIFVTAYSDIKLVDSAKITEPYAYIVKPYADCELRAAIEVGLYKHHMDQKLKRSEERFRSVAENALEWIWEIDLNGKYIYTSPGVENVIGYKTKDIINTYFYNLFHPDDRDNGIKTIFELLNRQWILREFVIRYLHKNESSVWLLSSWMPIFKNDALCGYRGAAIDITQEIISKDKLKQIISKYENDSDTMFLNIT